MSTGGGWVALSGGGTTELVLSGSDTIEVVEQLRWHNWDGSQWQWHNRGGGTVAVAELIWPGEPQLLEKQPPEKRRDWGGAEQTNNGTSSPGSHPVYFLPGFLTGYHLDSQQLTFSPGFHKNPTWSLDPVIKIQPECQILDWFSGKSINLKGLRCAAKSPNANSANSQY